MTIFDSRVCGLGEGPFWHPERRQFFWFDILGKKLLSLKDGTPQEWQFDEHHSAAGWVDADTLLIASETGLSRFDISSGKRDLVAPLEPDNRITRSNDGRADPWGGFWIGTMGKRAEPGAGAIYRYYKGEMRTLFPSADIPNAICFAPDQSCAYFTGVSMGVVMRQPLGASDGWPEGEPTPFVTLQGGTGDPDGAVTDAQGNLWLALWGGARVACFAPDGTLKQEIALPALQPTCPAFGGPDLRDLYVTSATDGIPAKQLAEHEGNGMTFRIESTAQGLPEPQVAL